jgi:hemerythrin-like domain-containing protein
MRITKPLRTDQEYIGRFLDALGGAASELGRNRYARADFFITSHEFIIGYIEGIFFRKQEFLIRALEDGGFPQDDGPIAAMRHEQKKSHEAAGLLLENSRKWKSGDEADRSAVGWATSEYTSVMRAHLERLKNLIYPLLEQTLNEQEEIRIIDEIQRDFTERRRGGEPERLVKILEGLEEELSDWK